MWPFYAEGDSDLGSKLEQAYFPLPAYTSECFSCSCQFFVYSKASL